MEVDVKKEIEDLNEFVIRADIVKCCTESIITHKSNAVINSIKEESGQIIRSDNEVHKKLLDMVSVLEPSNPDSFNILEQIKSNK